MASTKLPGAVEHGDLIVTPFVATSEGQFVRAGPTLSQLLDTDEASVKAQLFDAPDCPLRSWLSESSVEPRSRLLELTGSNDERRHIEVVAWRYDDHIEGTLANVTSLRDIRSRYVALVEKNPVGLVIIQGGIIVYANAAHQEFADGNIIGRRASDVVFESMHPDDRDMVAERIRRREAGETVPNSYRYRQTQQGDRERWQEVWSHLVEYRGRPAIQAVSRDVTDIVEAELVKERSEERLKTLAEHSSDLLMLVDERGCIEFVSPAIRVLLGREPQDLVGTRWVELAHPDDQEMVRSAHQRMLKSPARAMTFTYRVADAGGDWHALSVVGRNRVDSPAVGSLVINQRDTTDADTARSRFESLLAVAPDAMLVTNEEGRVTLANERTTSLFGRDVCDQRIADLLPALGETWSQLCKDGSYASWEGSARHHGVRANESTFPAEVSAQVNADTGGTHVFVAVRDLTELKNLEEQFHHSQKMEAVGRLAGGIAHDFNNLLTVIASATELALDSDPNPEVQTELEQVMAAQERAADLAGRLLTFSRQHSQRERVVDLNIIVDKLQHMLRRMVREDVQVRSVLTKGPLDILADASQLDHVITNLVVNARDAMPDGGVVTVETHREQMSETEIAGRFVNAGNYAVVEVRDTGSGMSPEIAARVFEPFYTTKEVGKGTGLGLSTVLGIVERAGGFVRLDSKLGEGTRVRACFPITSRAPKTDAMADAPERPKPLAGRVLVIEDDPLVRSIAERALTRMGASVTTAERGDVALELLASGRGFDLVLSDVVMPGLNGFEVRRRIRAEYPFLPVVLMTGYAAGETGLEGGEDEDDVPLLHKPFTVAGLRDALEPLLNARRLQAGASG